MWAVAWFAVVLACASSTPLEAFAQIPESFRGRPVLSIEVEGEGAELVDPSRLGVPTGSPLDRELVRTLLASMLATGRWADVQVDVESDPAGVRLRLLVVPRTIVARVEIIGNDAVNDEDLEAALDVHEDDDVDPSSRDLWIAALTRLYESRGYRHAEVTVALLATNDPSRKVMRVEIDEGEPTRVVRVLFEGDALPSPSPELRLFRVREGDIVNVAEMTEEVERTERSLREHGYFETVLERPSFDFDGQDATMRITSHVGPRYRVVVRGASPLSQGAVSDMLEPGETRLSGATMQAMASRVRELYLRNGFLDVEVVVRRARVTGDEVARLYVEIQTGPTVSVRTRRFPGAYHFTQAELDAELETYLNEAIRGASFTEPVDGRVAAQNFATSEPRRAERPPTLYVPPAEVYYASAYEEAITHVEELYAASGFLDARVGPATLVHVSPTEASVSIPIVEGPLTRVFSLEIAGDENVSEDEIVRAAALVRDAPFSYLAVEEAKNRVIDLYQGRGYLYANVTTEVSFSDDRSRAAIHIRIEERYEVLVDAIRIEGAVTTRESLIRALVTFEVDDLYTPDDARRTQDRLMELGIFSGVSVAPLEPDLPAQRKTIVVTVTERTRQFLDFRAGVSTAEGVRGAFEYGYRNLFGYAVQLTLRVQLSGQFFFLDDVLQERFERLALEDRLERRLSATILLPALPRLPSVRASFGFNNQRENERNFGIDKNVFDIALTYRRTRRLSATLSSSIESNDVELLVDDVTYEEVLASVNDSLRQLLRVPEGRSTLVAVGATVSLDRRDSPFSPTRGYYGTLTSEWARSLRTERDAGCIDSTMDDVDDCAKFFSHHLRTWVSLTGYVPLGDRTVLAVQGRYGRIIHLEQRSRTYPNRQFFVGGVDTVRAYRQDAMIPQDIADQILEDDSIDPRVIVQGGDTFLLFRTELRFPLIGDLGGAIFSEIGNLWADATALQLRTLRPTAGLGIRFQTPIGPIALDYGFNFLYRRPDRRPLDERFGAFNFSIGIF